MYISFCSSSVTFSRPLCLYLSLSRPRTVLVSLTHDSVDFDDAGIVMRCQIDQLACVRTERRTYTERICRVRYRDRETYARGKEKEKKLFVALMHKSSMPDP